MSTSITFAKTPKIGLCKNFRGNQKKLLLRKRAKKLIRVENFSIFRREGGRGGRLINTVLPLNDNSMMYDVVSW
uniref:Uncharacterized protein n=1 Tax=Rhizophora mucronata TaxID=61149 RepID=A0A2P2J4J9_RHIMU